MNRCPSCNAAHPQDALFCPEDGTPLASMPSLDDGPTDVRVSAPPNLATMERLLEEEQVEDIYVIGPGKTFLTLSDGSQAEFSGEMGTEQELVDLARYMLGARGHELGPDAPFADGTVKERYRVNVAMAPAAEPSPQIVIRRHRQLFTPEEDRLEKLIQLGTLSCRAALLMRHAMRAGVSVLVAGSTAAGKSTFLCALGAELPRLMPVICIEDSRELSLPGANVSHLLTRPASVTGADAVTQRFLVQAALRKRPRWIILGEARGEEAWDFAQAGNTGHSIMGSVHANDCRDALERYRDLSMTAGPNMREAVVLASVLRAFRLVVHLELDPARGSRVVRRIVDVTGNLAEGNIPVLQDLFIREGGRLRCKANRPYPRLRALLDRAGLDYDDVIHGRGVPDAWRRAAR